MSCRRSLALPTLSSCPCVSAQMTISALLPPKCALPSPPSLCPNDHKAIRRAPPHARGQAYHPVPSCCSPGQPSGVTISVKGTASCVPQKPRGPLTSPPRLPRPDDQSLSILLPQSLWILYSSLYLHCPIRIQTTVILPWTTKSS